MSMLRRALFRQVIGSLALLPVFSLPARCQDNVFALPEHDVASSPREKRELPIGASDKIVDFDIWSTGPEVAVLLRDSSDRYRVVMWDIASQKTQEVFRSFGDLKPQSIACHPARREFFVAGRRGQGSSILAVTAEGTSWKPQVIYNSAAEIRRLLAGPRPFETGDGVSYRLFFGIKSLDGNYAIRSITESGRIEYQMAGAENTVLIPQSDQPTHIAAPWALPSSFHPAGNILIWEDEHHCFMQTGYYWDWGEASKLLGETLCSGSVTVTPNGSALLHWLPNTPGITVFFDHAKSKEQQATEYTFLATPSSVPDGRGIVAPYLTAQGVALAYVPINVPLANVFNAWMFVENPSDQRLFSTNGGLFRDWNAEQLYSLFESEVYPGPGHYDESRPKRPFLVTTDIFWELFAAAYEGTFVVEERQRAIPAFWAFVKAANASMQSQPRSNWAKVLSALAELDAEGGARSPEAARILGASGSSVSSATGESFDYSELKPRGHYSSSPEMATYFKAFRYLTVVSEKIDPSPLASLPEDVKRKALAWIEPYRNYIAPSRAPLVWAASRSPVPSYARHPKDRKALFPLAWGFDNEVLLSTVQHDDWPLSEWVVGHEGERVIPRQIPSGLDVAAALGSKFARALLSTEIEKYPPLGTVLDTLEKLNGERPAKATAANLYDAWISALGVQWADQASLPGFNNKLWKAKRLQTGLASWASLRHGTVLVNERTAAEFGGPGPFEEIVLTPPRGFVEPDPETFFAIAELFKSLARFVESSPDFKNGSLPDEEGTTEALRQGILRRLAETEGKARLFAGIARKELNSESLSGQEYEEILYVGRVAEYNLLVFKSLADKSLALSNPDPMSKVADVAGGGQLPYLEAAVGNPLEWDQIVPYFGRREIVKGATYSYFEFQSPDPLNDDEWRKKLPAQPHPDWVAPYVSATELSSSAKAPF